VAGTARGAPLTGHLAEPTYALSRIFPSRRRKAHFDEHVPERLYVIDAELTFSRPVSADQQDDAEFAIGAIETPTVLKPSLRWVTPRRAVVGELWVSASTSGRAVEAARDSLRECVTQGTNLPVRSFAALSVKRSTR
jgi:hypothetical protein